MSRRSEALAGSMRDPGFRSLDVRAKTFSEDGRSVEAVISTETPVSMPDWSRMEMVPEVLLSKGAEFPKSRQIPFLDSHNRYSVKDQLGSARAITVNESDITATLVFGKSASGEDALSSVRDGHITDVSVGYEVLKKTYVPDGTTKTISGREFAGPVNVVTKWRLREVSLTPIGADAQAKLRGLDPAAVRFSQDERFEMDQELRALLVSRGMPAEYTDEQAQRWLIENAGKLADQKPEQRQAQASQAASVDAAGLAAMVAEATRKAIADATAQRDAFEADVRALCELAGLPYEFDNARKCADIAAVRNHLQTAKAKAAESLPFGNVRMVSSGIDRLRTDLQSTLIARAAGSALNGDTQKLQRYVSDDQRKAAEPFRHATLLDMATEFVRAQGINTLGLTREQIAQCAMFGPQVAGIRGLRTDVPLHTTGSFANLTLDAINKSMMIGYTEVPATWRGPMRQGDSVADFKTIHRLRLGGIPNLPVWNDAADPDRASMADAREFYAVECRSLGVDFSYKLIVNDDMSALTRVPLALGDSAARTVNAVAWSQITSNAALSDGVALFSAATGNRKQKNLETGSVSNYTTAINLLTQNMMTMRGENTPEGNQGPDILALMPRYICFPAALRGTLLQLLNSESDPSSNNSGVRNINTGLVPIIEPLLDADSATAFYLFAEPNRVDTVEVTFLQGQEVPQIRSVLSEEKLSMTYYVLQSVGAKALNHRGVQKHAGA
jgi:hypothetical protein